MKNNISIGIDNGVTGGIVAIDDNGQIITKFKMPIVKRKWGSKQRNFVDAEKLYKAIGDIKGDGIAIAYLERPTHAPSHDSLRSMVDSYATTRTVLELLLIHTVAVDAIHWQKTFWTKPKGIKAKDYDTKKEALRVANEKWEHESWLATSRSSVPHSGIVDAVLIAEYGRNLHLNTAEHGS